MIMKTTTKQEFINNLSEEQKQSIVNHFDTIYECSELTNHEYKITYLAWLWKKEEVYSCEDGSWTLPEDIADVDIMDYEITIEDETSGGVNLDVTYDYYNFDKLMSIFNDSHKTVKKDKFRLDKFVKDLIDFSNDIGTYFLKGKASDGSIFFEKTVDGLTDEFEILDKALSFFLTFSNVGVNQDEVHCADGKSYELVGSDEYLIGDVDTVGFLISVKEEDIKIDFVINYGGSCGCSPDITPGNCGVFEKPMLEFVNNYCL